MLLLADSDLLLVLSEKDELVILRASPESFKELAKIQAMVREELLASRLNGSKQSISHSTIRPGTCYRINSIEKSPFDFGGKELFFGKSSVVLTSHHSDDHRCRRINSFFLALMLETARWV